MPKIKRQSEYLFYDLYRDGVTQSVFEMWRECPKKCRLWMQGWGSPGVSKSLAYGTVLHAWLAASMENIPESYEEFFGNKPLLKKISKQAKQEYQEQMINAEEDGYEGFQRAEMLMPQIVPRYFRYWKDDFFGEMAKEFREIEKEFNIHLPGSDILLRGKRDAIFHQGSGLWLMEHKGKGMIQEEPLSMWIARDLQVNWYVLSWWLQHGSRLNGVLYNIIRNPRIYQNVGMLLGEYAEKVAADIDKRPDFYFMRFEVPLPATQQKIFQKNLEQEMRRFVDWYKNGPDTMYTHSCIGRYGNCPHMAYCDSHGQNKSGLFKRSKVFMELSGD